MLTTPFPIDKLVSAEQPLNAQSPIVVTLLGISTLVSAVQPLNALSPIASQILPTSNSTDVTLLAEQNKYAGIFVTFLPIVTFIPLPLDPTLQNGLTDNEQSFILEALKQIFSSKEQFLNTLALILVTLLGISMLVSAEQSQNASVPIVSQILPSSNSTDFTLLAEQNKNAGIFVTFLPIITFIPFPLAPAPEKGLVEQVKSFILEALKQIFSSK